MLANDLFVAEVRKVCDAIAPHAASNGLGQTLLRLCSPGIPDTDQGSELWNQSLVDPDTRRPVDFAALRRALDDIIEARGRDAHSLARRLLESYHDGRIKLYVTHVALMLRKTAPDIFLHGDYEPIFGGEHVVAFTRATSSQRIICCVTRLSRKKTGGGGFAVGSAWGQETLRVAQAGRYVELLTNRQLDVGHETPLSAVFQDLPVALLVQQEKRRRA
jgi:(1->4)-alpha-D-glucan 1-alpha-D-glucosylmutase